MSSPIQSEDATNPVEESTTDQSTNQSTNSTSGTQSSGKFDEEEGALDWNNLSAIDKPDDEMVAASALSGMNQTENSPSNTAAIQIKTESNKLAHDRDQVNDPDATIVGEKRKSAQPTLPQSILVPQALTMQQPMTMKRRRTDVDDPVLRSAYERQIATLSEAMRQLLAFVVTNSYSSGTDAYVDELISSYRGEYMKEQSRIHRLDEQKRYAKAMAAYFCTYYHSTSYTHLPHQAPYAEMANQESFPSLLYPSDPFEGQHHTAYQYAHQLLATVMDALLMDGLQITVWSIYLERFEPYWILESPPAQTRLLLLAAYAMKLAYVENHNIFLPYLSGLYANFSQILADYLHGKPGVKLGIPPQHLAARYKMLGAMVEDK